MTQWGTLLLVLYVLLGLSRATWRKAGRIALILTTLALVGVMASYGAVR
jgi:hypothetical protein